MYCSKGKTTDSPIIISDEEYYSPTEDGDKESTDGLTSRFGANFTASGEEMIDLTSRSPSSGIQTPESSQQFTYPHIKLLDFLSPGVSPKDLASSIIKKQSKIVSSQVSGNSSLVEPASPNLPDASAVIRYGVTPRSPVTSDELPTKSSVRKISPPQNPDELKRLALLPPDMRVTTPANTSIAPSSLMSAQVSIHKLDSPSSALTTSINQGMVSIRKKQPLHTSFNISSTTASVAGDSSQYKFSPPVEVLSQDKTSGSQGVSKAVSQHSANVSFPFSPPLTRSQRRKTVNQDRLNASKVELFSKTISEVDVDPAVNMAEVAEPDEPKESGKKKQKVSSSEVITTTTKRTYRTRYVLYHE